jgi:hypothetical protein
MNLLNKTKCTVIGPMQYANGRNIRDFFKNELSTLNVTIFNHYNKPFDNQKLNESEQVTCKLKEWAENEQYDKISNLKSIRSFDLALIEKSDFIIFHFIPNIVTVGSWEEFFLANRSKRPIFFITEGGKKLTPFWVFWTIPHNYIYSSKEDVLNMLKKINSGEKEIDSDRWRLLKPEYR